MLLEIPEYHSEIVHYWPCQSSISPQCILFLCRGSKDGITKGKRLMNPTFKLLLICVMFAMVGLFSVPTIYHTVVDTLESDKVCTSDF